jgi:hypothetical protein
MARMDADPEPTRVTSASSSPTRPLVAYFVGAVASHIRVRDFAPDHILLALVLLVVSAAALVLRLAS